MAHERRHRDADEEALQAALQESMQPDFLAQILEAEAAQPPSRSTVTSPRARTASADLRHAFPPPKMRSASDMEEEEGGDDATAAAVEESALDEDVAVHTDNESEPEEDEANAAHTMLNLADFLLLDVMYYLDEDSVGHCICTCKRLRHVAKSEALFEAICRRIFPVQCPRVAAAAAKNRFALRKFSSWFEMFHERPRVRYNGFYYLKTFYYKKPELNMWTDIVPGTILQVVYYRYFSFQRDGTVLYAMIFKPPHEAGAVLKRLTKEVHIGTFQVDKNELFVSVPTSHSVVEFKFRISSEETRGKNVKLVLKEHYAFSEPDRSGWVDYFETADEEFPFYRQWIL